MTYVPLPRALPHERGVDAAGIVDFLGAVAEAGLELHSFMLYRQGAVIAEAFWQPYSAPRMHVQHSATKSWTATAIGLLIADGRLQLSVKVVSFFPAQCPPHISDNLAAMTVVDLRDHAHRPPTRDFRWRLAQPEMQLGRGLSQRAG